MQPQSAEAVESLLMRCPNSTRLSGRSRAGPVRQLWMTRGAICIELECRQLCKFFALQNCLGTGHSGGCSCAGQAEAIGVPSSHRWRGLDRRHWHYTADSVLKSAKGGGGGVQAATCCRASGWCPCKLVGVLTESLPPLYRMTLRSGPLGWSCKRTTPQLMQQPSCLHPLRHSCCRRRRWPPQACRFCSSRAWRTSGS